MLNGDNESIFSISTDGSNCGISLCNKLEVKIPDLNIKKIISIPAEATVGMLKKEFINSLSTNLKDAINFGLFIPSVAGKAGKFLAEERTLSEYGLNQNHSVVELRYKRRLYRTMNINASRVKKLHSKANLKIFMDCVGKDEAAKVSKMLNKGLDPNYQLKETGDSPLIKACSLVRPVNMMKILFEGGAHLDYRNTKGQTPLHVSAIVGNLEAVKLILDLGQSPNTLDLAGLTPLYHTIMMTLDPSCAERLLYEHSVLGIEDENGLQEIHQACRYGHVQHVELLLQYKVDINCQTSRNGNTPLHICAFFNQESCARLLLFRGAEPLLQNMAGRTAYEQASLNGHIRLATLIRDYRQEDVVPLKVVAKYNVKRKFSTVTSSGVHRSRSVGGMSAQFRVLVSEDSQCISRTLYPGAPRTADNGASCLESTKRVSRSFNHLNEMCSTVDSRLLGTSHCSNTWRPNWEVDYDSDTMSNVSGVTNFLDPRNQEVDTRRRAADGHCRSGRSSRRISRGDQLPLAELDATYLPRIVALQKNSDGFGFVIRGLKASMGVSFVPTSQNPALQYMEEIEPGSLAARAGLLPGDFILEINNQSVASASHDETVQLIKAAGDILAMKVITVKKNTVTQSYNYDTACDQVSISSEYKDALPNNFLYTFTHHGNTYNKPNQVPTNDDNTSQKSSCVVPVLPLSQSLKSFTTRVTRNKTPTPVTRPDSVYVMPPPPSCDEYIYDGVVHQLRDSWISHSQSNSAPRTPCQATITTCSFTPPSPPPPPPPPPSHSSIHYLLESSKQQSLKPIETSLTTELDVSLRDALAKRRERIESDHEGSKTTIMANDGVSNHGRCTIGTLKQHNQRAHTLSNRTKMLPVDTKSYDTTGLTVKRTQSEASRNTGEDNHSRFLV